MFLSYVLQAFSEAANQQLRTHNVSSQQVLILQEKLNELIKEIEDIKKTDEVGYTKKSNIKAKLAAIAEGLLKILPRTSETIATFTPLAPFNKLIGEGVEEMIKAIQREV